MSRLRLAAFVLASVTAAALVLSAPFVGQARSAIRSAFPGQFGAIVNSTVAAIAITAIVLAVWRIRERRALRFGAVAGAVALAGAYAVAFRAGIPDVDAVERFHFVEYGLITLLFYRAWRPVGDLSAFVLAAICALVVGTVDEWFQWFIPARIGELPDIFLNGYAIVCGLLLSVAAVPPETFTLRLRAGSLRRMGVASAALVLVLGVFVQVVHLGTTVQETGVGTFKSRYTKDRLESLARDRAVRWRDDPPLVLRRLSREDQYMNEGIWHVQRRNELWADQRVLESWRENRILERFFAPVLDTPSYVSRTGHRWAPEQRLDAERRANEDGREYTSDANREAVYVWSPAVFWTLVASIAAALAVPAFLSRGSAARR